VDKPVPEPTPVSAPYWDGLRDRKIRIQYSPSTDRYVFYPRVLAPGSLSDDLEWRTISGRATLYTFSVAAYRATAPPWADNLPQILAIGEWEEGVRFSTELVNVEAAQIAVGMPLRPVFVDVAAGVTLLKYTAA
jgi:uncharacterized OB-fold protein